MARGARVCGGDRGAGRNDYGDEAQQYASQLRLLSMRCCVLRNQLDDGAAEEESVRCKRGNAQAVLEHLAAEEAE